MKKIIVILPIVFIVMGILIFGWLNSLSNVSNDLAIKKKAIEFPEKYEIYQTEKWYWYEILNPEYAFVNKKPDRDLEIMFYRIKRDNIFAKDYEFEYIGGTDIKNTTFENLVKMVKDDCYQFQEDYNNPEVDNGGIDWGYREYDREAEEQRELQEKLEYERLGMKRYESTPENLKKLEDKLREQEGVTEEMIQDLIDNFSSQEYFEAGGLD